MFDCTAKSQNGLYFNNTLLVGPCIRQDLLTNVEKLKRSRRVMVSDKSKDVQIHGFADASEIRKLYSNISRRAVCM